MAEDRGCGGCRRRVRNRTIERERLKGQSAVDVCRGKGWKRRVEQKREGMELGGWGQGKLARATSSARRLDSGECGWSNELATRSP